MEYLSEALSKKYPNTSSEDPHHYETIIFKKIVHMFHSFEFLISKEQDEVSARCLLRGILDSVTTYCFIYERADENEIMFRHYLYALDSFDSYKKSCQVYSNANTVTQIVEDLIGQNTEYLHNLPYYKQNRSVADTIIKSRNWKYISLENTRSMSYKEMYKSIGFEDNLATYYAEYLSQYVHGLFYSNRKVSDNEQLKHVLYESIPIADRMVRSFSHSLQADQMIMDYINSPTFKNFLESPDFNYHDLGTFMEAVYKKRTIIV